MMQTKNWVYTMIINLPWYPRECSPNARVHWSKLAEMKKKYRDVCFLLTKESVGNVSLPETGDIHVTIEFFPPAKRAYDLDNLLASIKSGLDGVAQALKVNDSRFTLTICKKPEIRGMIRLTITHQDC